jgi:hypothetical protein
MVFRAKKSRARRSGPPWPRFRRQLCSTCTVPSEGLEGQAPATPAASRPARPAAQLRGEQPARADPLGGGVRDGRRQLLGDLRGLGAGVRPDVHRGGARGGPGCDQAPERHDAGVRGADRRKGQRAPRGEDSAAADGRDVVGRRCCRTWRTPRSLPTWARKRPRTCGRGCRRRWPPRAQAGAPPNPISLPSASR